MYTKRSWNQKSDFNYLKNLDKAFKYTSKLDLEVPNFEPTPKISFSLKERQGLINIILDEIYNKSNLRVEDVALKCNLMSKQLQSYLKTNFNIDSLITCGYTYGHVKDVAVQINYESKKSIERRLKDRSYNKPINFHTWLTLSTFDIVDITFPPSKWIEFGNLSNESRENAKKIAWTNPENNYSDLSYKPIFVGYDYFDKVNIIPQLNFKIEST